MVPYLGYSPQFEERLQEMLGDRRTLTYTGGWIGASDSVMVFNTYATNPLITLFGKNGSAAYVAGSSESIEHLLKEMDVDTQGLQAVVLHPNRKEKRNIKGKLEELSIQISGFQGPFKGERSKMERDGSVGTTRSIAIDPVSQKMLIQPHERAAFVYEISADPFRVVGDYSPEQAARDEIGKKLARNFFGK